MEALGLACAIMGSVFQKKVASDSSTISLLPSGKDWEWASRSSVRLSNHMAELSPLKMSTAEEHGFISLFQLTTERFQNDPGRQAGILDRRRSLGPKRCISTLTVGRLQERSI